MMIHINTQLRVMFHQNGCIPSLHHHNVVLSGNVIQGDKSGGITSSTKDLIRHFESYNGQVNIINYFPNEQKLVLSPPFKSYHTHAHIHTFDNVDREDIHFLNSFLKLIFR